MHGFYRGGEHVLYKLAGLPPKMLMAHNFILSKAQSALSRAALYIRNSRFGRRGRDPFCARSPEVRLVAPCSRLYNQGNRLCVSGSEPMALQLHHTYREAREGNVRGKGQNVEERLKSLMQDLGNAINESLSDSERIAEAIGEIKRAGYDVFLVLEATIGFNKREEGEEGKGEESTGEPQEVASTGKVRFTTQDQRFLKALRIAVDEEVKEI